jgi:hypothetical protein
VAFSTDNGVISAGANYIVPSDTGCRSSYAGCPASKGSATFGNRLVTMKSDAVFTPADPIAGTAAKCEDSTSDGTFTVTVTTPGVTSGGTSFPTTITTATASVIEQ